MDVKAVYLHTKKDLENKLALLTVEGGTEDQASIQDEHLKLRFLYGEDMVNKKFVQQTIRFLKD